MKRVQMLNGSVEVADMVLECCFGSDLFGMQMMSKVSNGSESESQFHCTAVAVE